MVHIMLELIQMRRRWLVYGYNSQDSGLSPTLKLV